MKESVEQPPSAEAMKIAMRFSNQDDQCAAEIDTLCEQRVAAERERWQNRDRQRLEQIHRLQETADALSERDAAAIRVWSDGEEVAYQAGVNDTLARLQEPDEELLVAVTRVICPQRWENLNAGEQEREKAYARAAITKIAEMLK
jgi:hypothetical protein